MAYKKVSQLTEATEINFDDLFLISDMLGLSSKKATLRTLSNSLNATDLNGRFQEGSSYSISRDTDGFVTSISTSFGSVTKTFTFTRDSNSFITSVNIQNSDNSYNKTYTFVRNEDGIVTSILVS